MKLFLSSMLCLILSMSSLTFSANTERFKRQIACQTLSCTAEMLGCEQLAINEYGCSVCECVDVPVPPADNNVEANAEQNRGICLLPSDNGPCLKLDRSTITRYFFNRATNKCEPFLYGGCYGNDNTFEIIGECSIACEPPKSIDSADLVEPDIVACPLHACTAEILNCPAGTGLAINENGCELCKCAVVSPEEPLVPCPLHACTKELLGCQGELATNENGCDLCECAPVPCPLHSCTKEMLGCLGELAKNDNGCDLCECAPVPCPSHACTKELLGCPGELATNQNGCDLCECAPVPCPLHSCTKEMLGCLGELAKNDNGCDLCECASVVITPPPAVESGAENEYNRGICMLIPDAGTCRGIAIRYFFNRATNKCETFMYGGCRGNENNFETIEECLATCESDVVDPSPIPCILHACTPEILKCPSGTGLATNEYGCELCECEVKPVPCPLHSCTKEMLGCLGELATNENGCNLCECAPVPCPLHSCTKEMLGCQGELKQNENGCDLCECAPGTVITPSPVVDAAAAENSDSGVCLLPPDNGPCRGKVARYFFNRATDKCEPFDYGGCYGNENNFETIEECVAACPSRS